MKITTTMFFNNIPTTLLKTNFDVDHVDKKKLKIKFLALSILRKELVLLLVLLIPFLNFSQTNVAPLATTTHSSGGITTYGPTNYNDGYIDACNGLTYGWVNAGGSIEFVWSTAQNIESIKFFKADRPFVTCDIQYWNGSSYVTILNYNNATTCEHSISFPIVSTTRIRLLNIAGSSSPNFREIQIFQSSCTGLAITGTTLLCTGGTSDLSIAGENDLPIGATVVGNEYIQVFNANGTFTAPVAINNAKVLVVAGGGGGGRRHAGGGGAGGVIYNASLNIPAGQQYVTIGNGGTGGTTGEAPGASGTNGGNTMFGTLLTAIGGGGGGGNERAGSAGGSGGGGANQGAGGNGTASQGNKGGNHTANHGSGCGGGGAGVAAANSTIGSSGGNGVNYGTIFNTSVGAGGWFGGGGGGGISTATSYSGGTGGAGAGGRSNSLTGSNGVANSGGGAGGGGANGTTSGNGGNGGSGAVILRYTIPVKWTSSNTAVATVHPQNGLVTAISAGTSTITFTSVNGCVTTTVVSVGLTIAKQPLSTSACENGTASFAVASSSNSSSYQWEYSTSPTGPWTSLGAATAGFSHTQESALNVTASAAFNGRYFHAIITEGGCTLTSNSALLSVGTTPTDINIPTNQIACVGNNVTITPSKPTGTARYRVVLTSAHGGSWHGIQEIRGKNEAGTYQTLTGVGASSATYTDNPLTGDYNLTQAFDGVYNSGTASGIQWLTPEQENGTIAAGGASLPNTNWQNYATFNPFYTPEWIEFTSPELLTNLDIYNGRYASGTPESCYKDYYVLISYDNGNSWINIKQGTFSTVPGLNAISIEPSYMWKKGGTNVGSGKILTLNNITAAQAGAYSLELAYGCNVRSLATTVELNPSAKSKIIAPDFDPFCSTGSINLHGDEVDPSNWIVGAGGVADFNQNGSSTENERINGTNPWGNPAVIWEARPSGNGNDDGGFNTTPFPIDNTKGYRYSIWIKRTVRGANGNAYFGLSGFNQAQANTGVAAINTGTVNTNPYFWYSASPSSLTELPVTEWVLIVGHVYPNSHTGTTLDPQSGIYKADGTFIGTTGTTMDYKWLNDTKFANLRSYLYYSPDATTRQQFLYPRVDALDGTEPSIQQLLGGYGATDVNSTKEWYTESCTGTGVGTGTILTVNPTSTTTYYLKATNACGTSACDQITIQKGLPQIPNVSASNPLICSPATTDLIAKGMAPSDQVAIFNGSSSSVDLGSPASLQITGDQTIEMWIKPNAFALRSNPYAKAYAGEGTITFESGGDLNYYYGTDGNNGAVYQGVNSAVALPSNQWTHIALVRDLSSISKTIKWYINGKLVNSAAAVFPAAVAGTLPALIGNGYAGLFNGSIDNVRVWNVARTKTQIAADLYLESPTVTTGLVAQYNMNGNVNLSAGTATNGTPTNVNFGIPNHLTYTWSGGPNLPTASTNETQTTGSISTAGTHNYTAIASAPGVSCTSAPSTAVSVFVSNPSTALTAITPASPNACQGNQVMLTANGGTAGSNDVIVWQEAPCNTAYEQNWRNQPFATGATTVNSVNGILNVTSTSNDPMIMMDALGSFDPAIYRYVNIRYRVTAGIAASTEIFFYNTNHNYAIGGETGYGTLISDNAWHILSIDMHSDPQYLTGGNILGWRYDWATAAGVTMDIDFISLDETPIIAEGLTYTTPALTQTKTYYANRRSDCGVTSCISNTITLPTAGTALGNNIDNATCLVKENNFIHFYHSSGRLLASVNSHGQNLGNVTVTSYVGASSIAVPACADPTNPSYVTESMGRSWVITPSIQPTSDVTINLPFDNAEYVTLAANANTNSNTNDNLASIASLQLSKYSGSNENGAFTDNCGNGVTILLPQAASGSVTAYLPTFGVNGRYASFDISTFSEMWLHGSTSSPLPVKLTNFSATCNDDLALTWTTASEQNSDRFVIEKSRDGQAWMAIATQSAAGNSNTIINYSQVDENNWNGVAYYRLKQIDFNGEEAIYGPISTSCEKSENSMTVYPNPNNGSFTIEIASEEIHNNASLILTDMTGKIISTQKLNVVVGTTQILIDGLELQKGTYLVQIQDANAGLKPVKVLVK